MPLLVSVRSAEEVAAALAGGADIIDAKEPSRGSLGPVTRQVLSAISARTPGEVPLSVAVGDCPGVDAVRRAAEGARTPPRHGSVYLKIGFAGEPSAEGAAALLAGAVEAARPTGCSVVAAAYADHASAGSPAPEDVLRAAVGSGAGGLLVDTCAKDGRDLLDHLTLERIAALSATARGAGLLFALAGSLDGATIAQVAALADVVGVRGAACRGGRSGTVDAERVRELRRLAHAETVVAVG